MADDRESIRVSRTVGSEDEMGALARGFASLLRPGDVVALSGPLGAGKTTTTRMIAGALGVDVRQVSSPTFVFVNRYHAKSGEIASVTHVDAYRLTSADDLDTLGWDTLFDAEGHARPGSVALIEWPERLAEALPAATARAAIVPVSETGRRVEFALPASWRGRAALDFFLERGPARCPTTEVWVEPTAASYPFASERARMADLNKWFTGGYTASREIEPEDVEDL